MYLLRGVAVWMVIVFVESVHGTVRRLVLEPLVGDRPARQIAFFVGMALIFLVAMLCIRWIKAPSIQALFAVGLIWMVLTAAFELGLGLALGYTWERILEDYDVSSGGLMAFGLLFMVFAPWLAMKVRVASQ